MIKSTAMPLFFATWYCTTLPSFLREEFFAAVNRLSGYEETKPVELKIYKRQNNDAKGTSQGFNP